MAQLQRSHSEGRPRTAREVWFFGTLDDGVLPRPPAEQRSDSAVLVRLPHVSEGVRPYVPALCESTIDVIRIPLGDVAPPLRVDEDEPRLCAAAAEAIDAEVAEFPQFQFITCVRRACAAQPRVRRASQAAAPSWTKPPRP